MIICGQTATGKTSLAIKLAKKFAGEIVSADSRQVYRYLNIGTGKDLPKNSQQILNSKLKIPGKRIGYHEIDGVKVWLYDVVVPGYQFSVADYLESANLVMEDIWQRGKLPILVGGTGFYIKALIEGVETMGVKPDWELRGQLSEFTPVQLRKKLGEIDPERSQRMNQSDQNNPRRLIRAIEVARNKDLDVFQYKRLETSADIFWIGLRAPYKVLYQKIDQRVEERVKMGAEKEIKELLKKGYDFKNSVLGTTIGYREWNSGRSKEEIIQKWKFAEHGYARRQMTWFKGNHKINWFDIMKKDYQSRVESLVKQWYYLK